MFNLKKISVLIEMSRPHGMITPLCACFTGLYLAGAGFPSLADAAGAFAIIMFIWFGGVILNDYYDFDVDSITDPHRPLPSGRITRKEALVAAIAFLSAAIIWSALGSMSLLVATIILVILAVLYNSTLKKMGLIGSFSFGLIEGLFFAVGVLTAGTFTQLTLLVAVSIILLHTSVNITGAIKDIEGDKKIGNMTVPVKYGIDTTAKLTLFFLSFSFIVAILPGFLNLLNLRYLPVLLITCLWLITSTVLVKKNPKLGFMAFGIYYMGASIYYINFITGI
jgi:geranylgeranylglycerol-phosphate geranylgeranyltransferase